MFNIFKRKPSPPSVRETLFGDLPISQWPAKAVAGDAEPWVSFSRAGDHLKSGRSQEAVNLFRAVLAMPGLESRHYAQAWHFLRESGIRPDAAIAKELLGVVVEVALSEGLDIVAAYPDGTARYFNHSGAAVIWDAPDDSLRRQIGVVLEAGKVVVDQIGPWDKPRPPAPPMGQVRINLLTPSGLHFGQGPFDALATDQLGGPVISAATELMQSLTARATNRRDSHA